MGKGSSFERTMCKEFSLWWTNKERDDVFWRTSQSGGRATQRAKSGKRTSDSYGDMMAVDEDGKPLTKFILTEFKKGYSKDLGLLIIIDGKQQIPILKGWWDKNEKIRKESGRQYGVLIFQRDYKKPCIVMDSDLFGLLESYIGEWCMTDLVEISFTESVTKLVAVPLFPFFDWCSSETMRHLIEDQNTLNGSAKNKSEEEA